MSVRKYGLPALHLRTPRTLLHTQTTMFMKKVTSIQKVLTLLNEKKVVWSPFVLKNLIGSRHQNYPK